MLPVGFEPTTYCLEGSYSVQLSYESDFYMTLVVTQPLVSYRLWRHRLIIRYKEGMNTLAVFFC
jgi:hypothetical protein